MWCTLGSMYVKWKTWKGWSTKTWLFKSVSTWHTVSTYTVIRGTHQSISSSICNCSNIIHAFYYVQVIVNTLFYYKIQFVNQVKKYTKWIQFDQYMLLSNNAKRHVKCLYLWSFKYYHLYFMNIEYLCTYCIKEYLSDKGDNSQKDRLWSLLYKLITGSQWLICEYFGL